MHVKTLAITGLGSIGRRHAKNALSLGYNVVGFDPSEKSCAAALEETKHHIKISSSELEAIEQGDAVIIASPHKYHMQSLEYCVRTEKSALVEKPIATQLQGLESILQEASQKNLTIACGFNLRFRPIIETARKCCADIGRPLWARFICASYLPEWRPQSNYLENYTNDPKEGGIIFDIAHELDLAQFLLGKAQVVSAFADNSGLIELKAEDRASITLKHDNGALSHVYLDYTTRPKQRGFEIAGVHGLLKVDLTRHHLELFAPDGHLQKEVHLQNYNTNDEYIDQLKDFIEAIEKAQTPKCSGLEGLANLHNIIEARKMAGLL